MTEPGDKASRGAAAFYDSLAPDYDEMTGFGRRFTREGPIFRLLVEKHGIGTALDAGCGTGFHSLLLAQSGVRVTALDVSGEMLGRVERHAKEMDLVVRTVQSDFKGVPGAAPGSFDAVFCMGNTIPHLLTGEEIRAALEAFAAVLRPGGILVVQILNYDRILSVRERVVGSSEARGVTFVRFYDFEEGDTRIGFNILRIEKREDTLITELLTVPLLPLTSSRLAALLDQSGNKGVKRFGSIAMDPYDPSTSRDLVVMAMHS